MRREKVSKKRSSGSTSAANVLLPRYLLIVLVVGLSIFGLIMVYSASSVRAFVKFADAAYYLKRQAMWIGISAIFGATVASINYKIFKGKYLTWILWGIMVALLIAVFFVGGEGNLGGQRWFYITDTISFQPSEYAKLVLIVLVAKLLCDWHEGQLSDRRFAVSMAVAALVPLALIVMQPDLGTSVIMIVTIIGILFLGGISTRVIAGLGGVAAIGAGALAIIAPYRLKRVLAINPWADPLKSGWQVINSLYAFGSGGLFGVGLGFSRQKYFYLPEAHTDFIFAIVGEELGLVGATLVVLAFVAFGWAGLQIARNATDRFGRLIAGGATITLIFQAFVNIMCVIGLLPVTGKPLPFISSGGSSMLATFIAVGMILSVSFHSKRKKRSQMRRDTMTVIEGSTTKEQEDAYRLERRRNGGARLSGTRGR